MCLPKLEIKQDEKFTKIYVTMAIVSKPAYLINPFTLKRTGECHSWEYKE
jgi:hypothetical protein